MSQSKSLIIAEAGVNHNGSLDNAKKLIDVAKFAGVDVVKFQTFRADNLVTKTARKAQYQAKLTDSKESQYDMLKKLELSFDDFRKLAAYCRDIHIEFLSTAFDEECLAFLVEETGIQRIKMPSGEITNGPLLHAAAKTKLPLILSTGMSDPSEIELAIDLIAATQDGLKIKGIADFKGFYRKQKPKLNVQILHCTSEYPAKFHEINLRAMHTLRDLFGLPIGLSDHSEGILASIAAVAMGATVIEKHFTLDKTMAGPDHVASLSPQELRQMVKDIRDVESMFGTGVKQPFPIEKENAKVARKSLTSSTVIRSGEQLLTTNICTKRPGIGMSPMLYWDVVGKYSSKDYQPDEPLNEGLSL